MTQLSWLFPAAALAGTAATGIYALGIEPFRLELTTPTLLCPRLPREMDGLKILLIADTHIQHYGKGERGLLHLLRGGELAPDIVVWAGDILQKGGNAADALAVVRDVRELFSVTTYAVMGNSEHKIPKRQRADFIRELRNLGLRVLNNASDTFAAHGAEITVVGVDDPYYGHADMNLAFAGADTSRFTLFLAHSPQVHTVAARRGADVMLSGHTHGGQVRLPFVGALRTQNPLHPKMDMGIFDRARMTKLLGYDPGGDMVTYITRGVGVASLWRIPLYPRFLCRPEVALITLRRSTSPV